MSEQDPQELAKATAQLEKWEAMEQGMIDRLMAAGWITKAVVLDNKGIRSFEWTDFGKQRCRELHRMLVELGFRDGRAVTMRRGEYDILVDFTGDCIAHYGLE
jgi:hypothetical protein